MGLAYSMKFVFSTAIIFIPALLAIVAFFFRNSMADTSALVWLYFIAAILNGIGFLLLTASLLIVTIWGFGKEETMHEYATALIVVFIILLGNWFLLVCSNMLCGSSTRTSESCLLCEDPSCEAFVMKVIDCQCNGE
uniref:Uncharacterized protein n=1 Tax=Ditylenchus dipsaci TaxID=166011 RepID=A0A915EH20_9BILA